MKTYTKSTALFFAALLLSLNIFATGIEFDQENYIDDIPFNMEEVVTQITYENAITVDFALTDEDYIDDIPVLIDTLTYTSSYSNIPVEDFSFEEEEYINDIPSSILNISSCDLYAKVN